MTPDQFIDKALDEEGTWGGELGLQVWLITEAELLTDMDGVDSFLERYDEHLVVAARAFETIGATEIGGLLRVVAERRADAETLDRLNLLISERSGYTYQAIAAVVRRALHG